VTPNLTVQSGGTVNLTGHDGVDPSGRITVQGSGLFNAAFDQTIATLSGDGRVQIGSGAFFTLGWTGLDNTFSGTTSGSGTLVKTGGGFLTLTGSARLDAPLWISGGVLIVTGTDVRVGSLRNSSSGEVRLGAGQRLRAGATSNSGLIDVIGNATS